MDEQIRNLERLASQGDEQAQAKLYRLIKRANTPEEQIENALEQMIDKFDEKGTKSIVTGKYRIKVENIELERKLREEQARRRPPIVIYRRSLEGCVVETNPEMIRYALRDKPELIEDALRIGRHYANLV